MATYASDLTASLSAALVQLAPTLVPNSPPTPDDAAVLSQPEAAQDRTEQRELELRRALAQLQPAASSASSTSRESTSSSSSTTSALSTLGPSTTTSTRSKHRLRSPRELADLATSLFPPTRAEQAPPPPPHLASIEYVVLAQLTIAAYGTVLRTLMHQAAQLERSDEYWASVESAPAATAMYLVQSTPERALALGTVSLTRFKQLATVARSKGGERPPIWSRETWKRAVPPSLFLSAVFPHLSAASGLPSLAEVSEDDSLSEEASSSTATGKGFAASGVGAPSATDLARLGRRTARSLFFLTLSPLSLTRAEVAQKRRSLRAERDRLATRIGELTLATNAGGVAPATSDAHADTKSDTSARVDKADLRRRPGLAQLFGLAAAQREEAGEDELSLDDVKQATWQSVKHLEAVLAPASPSSESPQISLAVEQGSTSSGQTPNDLAQSLVHLLTSTLASHDNVFRSSSGALAPPGALARAWPYLLSVPLVGGIVARTVYNNRASLRLWAQETVSTVRGFLIDWVVEPVRHILETLRGGDEGGIALMGRESLKSDLASLERMVVDFARDEYKLGPDELQVLAEQVKAGDLTPVLRVWEEDIKSPIRSAVRGSLVRTLLIQVQKVKVDVALAMDGIEKMLKSQQLTFGFVGVAPSMLILALLGRWVKGLVRSDGSRRKRSEEKRRCWMVIRNLDLLLSPTRSRARPQSQADASIADSAAALTQGHLLLSLSSLRGYAHSSHFPSRDTQLRSAFLEDVRAVEDGATQAGKDERRALVRRLERWGDALGWHEGVRA